MPVGMRGFVGCGLLFAMACSHPPAPAPAETAWVKGVKPWYCGQGPLLKDAPAGTATQPMAMRLAASDTAITGTYGIGAATDPTVGTLTRFKPGGERTAQVQWKDDHEQKGQMELVFAPDYGSVTVLWRGEADAVIGTASLVASDSSACAASALIR